MVTEPRPRRPLANLSEPRQLLVEGVEEIYFFTALKDHLGLNGIQIHDYGGIGSFRDYLKTFMQASGYDQVTSIGIIRDADSNASSALDSIKNSLGAVGLPVPKDALAPIGTNPQVSILILPHGSTSGMLEDVCLESVLGNPAMECVSNFMQCLEEKVQHPPSNPAKARIHAFLSSRPDPELRLGIAAQRGYFPWEALVFEPLKQFLRLL